MIYLILLTSKPYKALSSYNDQFVVEKNKKEQRELNYAHLGAIEVDATQFYSGKNPKRRNEN